MYAIKENVGQSNLRSRRFSKLIVLATIIELFFFLGEISNNMILSLIALTLLIGFSACSDLEYNMYILLFLLANQRYIVLPGSDTTILNIVVLIIFFKATFKSRKLHIDNMVLAIILSIYGLSIFMRFGSMAEFFTLIKGSMTIMAMIAAFLSCGLKEDFYFNCTKFLGLGCLIAAIITFFLSGDFVIGTTLRFSGGDNNNANIFGAMISYAIVNVLVVYIVKKDKSKFWIVEIALLTIFGLLTQSRSFLLCIGFAAVYTVIFGINLNRKARRIIMLMFLGIFTIIIISIINPESFIGQIFNSAINRIINPRNGDISNGRIDLWFQYIKFLEDNIKYLMLGIGNHWYEFGFNNVAHNGVLELVVTYGLIGSIIIFVIFIMNWFKLKRLYYRNTCCKFTKIKKIYYLPFLIQVLANMTGHNFFNLSFIIQTFMSWACVYSLTVYTSQKKIKDIIVEK